MSHAALQWSRDALVAETVHSLRYQPDARASEYQPDAPVSETRDACTDDLRPLYSQERIVTSLPARGKSPASVVPDGGITAAIAARREGVFPVFATRLAAVSYACESARSRRWCPSPTPSVIVHGANALLS